MVHTEPVRHICFVILCSVIYIPYTRTTISCLNLQALKKGAPSVLHPRVEGTDVPGASMIATVTHRQNLRQREPVVAAKRRQLPLTLVSAPVKQRLPLTLVLISAFTPPFTPMLTSTPTPTPTPITTPMPMPHSLHHWSAARQLWASWSQLRHRTIDGALYSPRALLLCLRSLQEKAHLTLCLITLISNAGRHRSSVCASMSRQPSLHGA
jgi:hypothetical protein